MISVISSPNFLPEMKFNQVLLKSSFRNSSDRSQQTQPSTTMKKIIKSFATASTVAITGLLTFSGTASANPSIEEINEWLQRKSPMICPDYHDAKIENCSLFFNYYSDGDKIIYETFLKEIDLRSFEYNSTYGHIFFYNNNKGETIRIQLRTDKNGNITSKDLLKRGYISCNSGEESQRFAKAIKAAAIACGAKADLF